MTASKPFDTVVIGIGPCWDSRIPPSDLCLVVVVAERGLGDDDEQFGLRFGIGQTIPPPGGGAECREMRR
ncbi:hypothetical protein ACFYV7_20815 [Nocardia suismassiliense]|uniref:Uncharacterized protein n=1 Tax=Nocardia suismassiliense TaxID=2077092 RepID=A0ABW6QWP0_9NOCA